MDKLFEIKCVCRTKLNERDNYCPRCQKEEKIYELALRAEISDHTNAKVPAHFNEAPSRDIMGYDIQASRSAYSEVLKNPR